MKGFAGSEIVKRYRIRKLFTSATLHGDVDVRCVNGDRVCISHAEWVRLSYRDARIRGDELMIEEFKKMLRGLKDKDEIMNIEDHKDCKKNKC